MSGDIRIKQGNNPVQTFIFPTGMDLTDYFIQLNVVWQASRKTYGVGTGLSLQVTGGGPSAVSTILWAHSLADSRAFPVGRVAQYEIEFTEPSGIQRSGGGYLMVEAGVNLDV